MTTDHKSRLLSFSTQVVCLLILLTNIGGEVSAESPAWTAFQNGGSSSLTTANLPTKWSPDANIAWTADIQGYGQSAPVVSDGQVVVTSTSGENKEKYYLSSFAIESGEQKWQLEFENPTRTRNNLYTSLAAPTAVADSGGFIAFFEGGIIVATTAGGEIRWQKNLVDLFGSLEIRHGLSASLEHDDARVFVWVERSEEPYLLALDKQTGDEVWKVSGLGTRSWASPRLITVGGDPHLVCSASGKIVGFDPATGKRLWEFDSISNNKHCTPMPVADGSFLIGASDGRGETGSRVAAESTGLIDVTKNADGQFAVNFKWNAQKATSSFGSPVVAGNSAAIVNRAGVLFRLSLDSGETIATERTKAGEIWATPIVVGDLLYLFGSKGTTSIVSLSDGSEVATNRCWGRADKDESDKDSGSGRPSVLYGAAAAPPYLILRTGDKLFAIKSER